MPTIRPSDLPAAASVNPAGAFIVDQGATVEKATAAQVVDAAIPLASQAEAEAGVNNTKRTTPLRVKQAIDALGVSAANLASTDSGKGAALMGFKQSGTGAIARTAEAKMREAKSVTDFGADGVGDDYAAFQASVNATFEFITIPQGAFTISSTIDLGDPLVTDFVGASPSSTSLTNSGSGFSFSFIPTSGTQVQGPALRSFTTYGQNGVKVNDKTVDVTSGSMMIVAHWRQDNTLLLDSVAGGTGVGYEISKGFNGSISGTEIRGFGTGLILNGCDLNTVQNSRIWQWRDYGILEVSSGTYGSQNHLVNLDILGPYTNSATAVFFKTCGLHARMYDSYMEATSTAAGYFDVSKASLPAIFGANTPSDPLSVVFRDNRLDSQDKVDFVYRIDPEGPSTIRIEGIATTGLSSATVDPSYFVETDGSTRNDVVPLFRSNGVQRRLYIEENTFDPRWDGYRVEPAVALASGVFTITGANIRSLLNNVTGAAGVAHLHGNWIVIPQASTNEDLGIRIGGDEGGNPYFPTGTTIELTVLARSTSASGDTLRVQVAGTDNVGGGFGTSFTDFTLTDQFKPYTMTFSGYPSNYQAVGFNFRKSTSNGNVEFVLSWTVQ